MTTPKFPVRPVCRDNPPWAEVPGKIDIHAHFIPDFYRDALTSAGQSTPDGLPALPNWDPSEAIATMDRLNIATAVLSISSPGVHLGDAAGAVELARLVNEAGARLVRDTPGRFGLFASLPLPEIDAAVTEARYALDVLNADGVILLTNHQGIYPGNERLTPLYAELDARSAVILFHPTSPPSVAAGRFAAPVLEFMFETTRAICDLVISGTLLRFPRLRVTVPHAGAALAVLAGRVDLLGPLLADRRGEAHPPSLRTALANLHFDLAGCPVDEQLAALLDIADPTRLHYGSDYPFTPENACQYLAGQLDTSGYLDGAASAVLANNSRRLLPRLGAIAT